MWLCKRKPRWLYEGLFRSNTSRDFPPTTFIDYDWLYLRLNSYQWMLFNIRWLSLPTFTNWTTCCCSISSLTIAHIAILLNRDGTCAYCISLLFAFLQHISRFYLGRLWWQRHLIHPISPYVRKVGTWVFNLI